MKHPRYLIQTELLMKFFGLWPLKSDSRSRIKIVADIFRIVLGILFLLFLITVGLGFLNVQSEKEFKINYFLFVFYYCFCVWKMVLCQTKTTRLLIEDIYRISEKIMSGEEVELKIIFAKSCKHNFMLFAYLFILSLITQVLFTVSGVKDFLSEELQNYYREQNQTLPFKITAWYPVDTNQSHAVFYLGQCFLSAVANMYNILCESLFLSMFNFATLRIRILKWSLAHLGDCKKVNLRPKEIIKSLVREHQDIIRYVGDLDYLMRWLFFGDFIGKSYHLTILLFYISEVVMMRDINTESLFAVACTMFVLSLMFSVYYSVNNIALEALSIDAAVYESNWYEQPIDIQRLLLVVMIRSQRPLELHIGNLDTVSITTLLKVLKAGYTYVLISR
nr:odorant receptor [Semanotus bifasciatus]